MGKNYKNRVVKRLHTYLRRGVEEYSYFFKNVQDYFYYFGPIREIFFTPYFHIATLISLIMVFCGNDFWGWAENAINILPDILGFSIGGYAIIIAFGDEKFRKFLAKAETKDNKSMLLIVNGTFIHFILSQTLAILLANIVISIEIQNKFINFICCTTFIYSLLFCVAVAFEIKTLSRWYRDFLKESKK